MAVPLDQRYVSHDSGTKTAALDPDRKETIDFIMYQPPPFSSEDKASYEEWLERITFIEDDLHLLLKMPHDKFWCQVVFDETLHQCIDSYLRHAPRSYDLLFDLPPGAKEHHNQLHRLIFLTCLRMATHKESKGCFITPNVFGEILYENFIFDIPKLMDICVLYGNGNGPLLSKMISNIFTQQPKYEEDLNAVVPTVLQVLETICKMCGVKIDSGSMSPQKLNPGSTQSSPLVTIPIGEFQDLIFYLADTSATLWAFLDVYPAGCFAFRGQDFPLRLAGLYEGMSYQMSEAFRSRTWDDEVLRAALKNKLHMAQTNLLRVFRQILFHTCLTPLLENSSADDAEGPVEDYLHIMASVLSERRFLAHLETLNPFAEDQDLLSQSAYTIDETRLQFIEEGITEACGVFGCRKRIPKGKGHSAVIEAATVEIPKFEESDKRQEVAAAYETDEYETAGACAPRITGIELESLITSVKDLLPDLGEGFIELCLEEFNYEIERVINAVLEDKLPHCLQELDRNLTRQKPSAEDLEGTSSLLDSRQNVFDNDEFDVFKKETIDTSKIHKGKREKTSTSLLDDKSGVIDNKELYSKYGSQDVTSMYDINEYEDEYDDTYDTNEIGADDADSADELTSRRPFTVPRVLGGGGPERDNQESEASEEEEPARSRDNFVEDPAKIRERQAQREATWQQRQPKKGRNAGGHHNPQGQGSSQDAGQGQRKYDVKGNPKGQGQDKDTLKNRAWKEKHKSSRVNHNRRVLADKKRKF